MPIFRPVDEGSAVAGSADGRSTPADSASGQRRLTRRALLKAMASAAMAVPVGGAAYGFFYERHSLSVTRETLSVRGFPPGLDGLTIGLLTDIHRSEWVSDEDVSAAVDALLNARPDLIVLGGDYVTWGDRRFVSASAEALARLTAPHGVFAILGNHDDDRDMPAALSARGMQVLRDARTRLRIRGESLELAGIRFWTRRTSDIARVVRGAGGPVILLAHDPRRLPQAAMLDIPLLLSGHTHGGQVVVPGVGAIASQRFPVLSGVASSGPTTMFVSRGLGTVWLPVRVNCPPEVAILTVRAA